MFSTSQISVINVYSGKIKKILKSKGVERGDRIRIKKGSKIYEGILMPRIQLGDRDSLVIKLENGYNIGLRYSDNVEIELISKHKKVGKKELKPIKYDKNKPRISILSMGGTIASRVDYRTGGVVPRFTAEELIEDVPELREIANIYGRQVESILSENMEFKDYKKLIREVKKEIENGVDGIIITHGTDTLHYTAAALSFALENLPIPVILVGAQRSSDRASSDGPMNLICATQFIAKSDFGEIGVCMHATESDDYCFIHPACKIRKMHTSRRDAFRTINSKPWAKVYPDGRIEFLKEDYVRRDAKRKLVVKDKFEEKTALVKVHPSISPKIIDVLVKEKYRGLVIEGTGLGHAPSGIKDSLKRFLKSGIVVMTSQCLDGRINMNVYSTGRELQEIGVIPGEDMLPEVAYIKLSWLLGNYKDKREIKRLIKTNLRGEISERSEF
ncbi:MAG: Glu-tRNA(Gln) amidotransferase subunit GatD [Candidatus Aenigmarchaeota archaeon]|nr:Glu-tRNA(Gln) amidotransferase subunit GatD [Candidatus Aenigmarchaeota archaeon]